MTKDLFEGRSQSNPQPLITEMNNIFSVELVRRNNAPSLVYYTHGGRRYIAKVELYDVTDEPFFNLPGLNGRLGKLDSAPETPLGGAEPVS